MKLKKPLIRKLLRTLEDARVQIDESTPTCGIKMRKLDSAYDALLSVEDVLRRRGDDGSRKR